MEKTTENLESQVKEVVSQQLLVEEQEEEVELTRETSFEDLGADSLDMVEIVMEFEDKFDLVVPDEDTEDITTVGEAVDYLEDKLEE